MGRRVHTEPPLTFDDVARIEWSNYVEARTNHLHQEKVTKPSRKRPKRGEAPIQRHEDGLRLYMRTHGH